MRRSIAQITPFLAFYSIFMLNVILIIVIAKLFEGDEVVAVRKRALIARNQELLDKLLCCGEELMELRRRLRELWVLTHH